MKIHINALSIHKTCLFFILKLQFVLVKFNYSILCQYISVIRLLWVPTIVHN